MSHLIGLDWGSSSLRAHHFDDAGRILESRAQFGYPVASRRRFRRRAEGVPSSGPFWTLCSEVRPLKGRDFGIGCSTMTNWIANMIVGGSFLSLLNRIGKAGTFWLYAAFNAVFLLLTFWLVPETKHISLEHSERNLIAAKPLRQIGQ